MELHVDFAKAKKKLIEALKAPCDKNDEIAQLISNIISGSHKTYKYILVNGLLAKATNTRVNPLALQAGAPIDNAYDARSLCHKVLVPFERDFLQKALGGSNEPFLNKPARFTHLALTNAVRAGNDKETLTNLIFILSSITTSADAEKYLACAIKCLISRIDELSKINDSSISFNPTIVDVYDFICQFIEKSFEGETCAIVVGTLEKIYHAGLTGKYLVVPHKVNQSGSSSKEIGDIDIFNDGIFCYSIEVKDKAFTVYDLEFAFDKIIAYKGKQGAFIFGPRGTFDEKAIKVKLYDYEKKKFTTLFSNIYAYSRFMLFKSNITDKSRFIEVLMETAIQINSKESTREWVQQLLLDLKWK